MVFFVVKVMPQEVANVLRPRHKLSEASNPLTLFLFESVEKRTTITSNPKRQILSRQLLRGDSGDAYDVPERWES